MAMMVPQKIGHDALAWSIEEGKGGGRADGSMTWMVYDYRRLYSCEAEV